MPGVGHHGEMTGAAEQHLGAVDQRARGRAEAVIAVLADADDAEPARHQLIPALSALTAAAAMALPPRRPHKVR